MREKVGDLWQQIGSWKCITTNACLRQNGRLVMGKGNALEARNRFPGIDLVLGGYIQKWGNRCFILPKWQLVTFPTKGKDWLCLSDLGLIKESCGQLIAILDKFKIDEVFLPRPGCGCGGRSWKVVKDLISSLLDNRVIIISPSV